MALYDGFFDAVLNEDTYQYDREYDSGSFTEYFGKLIGSGVCVHGNENSMKVGLNGTSAFIAPGYLFIQGHWLKNTAEYTVPISGVGVHAVLAHLNMGARRIEVGSQPKADPEEYPNALVLAYVTVDSSGAVSVEDTRYRTDICGVINSAGALASKVEWAIHYINNEIELKLKQVEADIKAQEAVLDKKIAEVNALVEKLAPPPIGTIKFSASQDIEEGWLRCDGSFVSETDYPELVAALGKHTPNVSEFYDLAQGVVSAGISNAVIHDGTIWVYSFESKTLYGLSLSESRDIKEIPVTGTDGLVSPNNYRIWLSICDNAIFLAQQISEAIGPGVLLYGNYNFDTAAESISLTQVRLSGAHLSDGTSDPPNPGYMASPTAIPMVLTVSKNLVGGVEKYYIACGGVGSTNTFHVAFYQWDDGDFGPIISAQVNQGGPSYARLDVVGVATGSLWSTASGAVSLYSFSNKFGGDCLRVNFSHARKEFQFVSFPSGAYSGVLGTTATSWAPGQNSDYSTVSISDKKKHAIIKYNVSQGVFSADYLDTTTSRNITSVTADKVNLTSRAQAFEDAAMYLGNQSLWVFFVGTGLLFTADITDASGFGFLDTTDTLGVIAKFGQLEYDEARNALVLSGQDSTGTAKIGVLKIPTIFDYANDGAWLPRIASDGVPAYIKAKEAT